jgi:hypothetical protein
MKEILSHPKTIRQLLANAKYAIDYYQREYKWERKQVAELLNDLTDHFLESYTLGDERAAVEHYGRYFLGSIIISNKDGRRFVVDGQQRLSTLTLLLIHLYHLQRNREDRVSVADLVLSELYAKKSFNLDVPERTRCMHALFNGEPFDEVGQPESVRNILARYADIQELFPEELTGPPLPYFVDWLIDNVHLVEITATSDDDAYTIFETMNDRGLSLSPTDMLKGYLLANITDDQRKLAASHVWKDCIGQLQELGKDEDADCLKAWLRSQYAKTIRERKRGAVPQDFDRIGTEFHRWVRDHAEALGLAGSGDFARFIEHDFDFYARQYFRIRKAALMPISGWETVFSAAQLNFTLQYPVLLAPLAPADREPEILRKLRVTGAFLDILIARRIWNFRAIDYSTMQYAMFLVMRDIRGKCVEDLVELLRGRLENETDGFASNDRLRVHGQNRRQIHWLLARMTDYLETCSGMPSRFAEYIARSGQQGYEVEHIWSNHPERHPDEFVHAADFSEYRNRLGGLLLLPKSFNASYGDRPYGIKREHYNSQNLLARTLHEQCYKHNPGFLRFVQETGVPFRPHPEFKKADLDARHALARQLAELVWSPDRLAQEAAS